MSCGNGNCKCGSGRKLCPISLGLAIGITWGLAALLFALWVMHYGLPPMMAGKMVPVITYTGALMHGFWALVKGFLMGFFVALFYDIISCCCKSRCCKKPDGACSCGCTTCGCGTSNNKPVR